MYAETLLVFTIVTVILASVFVVYRRKHKSSPPVSPVSPTNPPVTPVTPVAPAPVLPPAPIAPGAPPGPAPVPPVVHNDDHHDKVHLSESWGNMNGIVYPVYQPLRLA